jgi:tRNA A-37 threonylcarbamoyl transferase component Bud32
MLPHELTESVQALAAYLAAIDATEALMAYWRTPAAGSDLPSRVRAAADVLDRTLPELSHTPDGASSLAQLFDDRAGVVLLVWCVASATRSDTRVAPMLQAAAKHEVMAELVPTAALARVLEGPLVDALRCAPLAGSGQWLANPDHLQSRARLDILLWEAGASALQLPELGPWLWGVESIFENLVASPARGTLRGRVLAARTVETCARGIPLGVGDESVVRTLKVLQPLLLHPEPMVWVHAARAVGRLAGVFEPLEGTLLEWLRSESLTLRQRGVTAFASQGSERLSVFAGELVSIVENRREDEAVLGAAAAATPYLLFDRRDLWERLARRVLDEGAGGGVAARALARGLATLWRRGQHDPTVETPLRRLRERARRSGTSSLDEWRRWLDVLSVTDPVDGAERDPLDLEQGLENLVRLAAQYDDEEADARAARFAGALAATFQEARRVALTEASPRRRAAGLNAVEGIARSLALGLWGPLLDTAPATSPVPQPDLEDTWRVIADAPEEFLNEVARRRREGDTDAETQIALEVLAVRLGGYALDACGEEPDLGPGRGPTAHHTCLWLRKVEGLLEEGREFPAPLRAALSALLWRLVDTTRGTALGEQDDIRWLGPFAAWWALVIDRPAMLLQLASALPVIAPGALERCCELADVIRAAVSVDTSRITLSSDSPRASDPGRSRAAEGAWRAGVARALGDLYATDTELARALLNLADALARFTLASGARAGLEPLCLALALAAERLHVALEDPVKALHPSPRDEGFTSENAPRVAALVARSIRARDLASLGVWFGSLGPVTSALVEAAVTAAVRRTPPPPPSSKKPALQTVEGYELVRPLGEGGVGSVWLVRRPGADRLFVLKIPKADALADATEKERQAILVSFTEEARALAGLYHPNVANIIDRGVSNGAPFLVLEYLIGADLKAYANARLMSLFELRSVVSDTCAGLAALHAAGLVHRDIKPANLWLRLPLQNGETFDPAKHRDPARTPPLSTVVIDFGMVRAQRVSQEAVGRFVAGTPGYIAPEQVLDPLELDGRADVYALAGTVYNATTGRTFFDEVESPRSRILAHMNRDPFEDEERLRGFPSPLVKLLRASTSRNVKDRPQPLEFGREFASLFA